MHKILQNHLLCAFVVNLKIDALYPESFCDKNLAIWKVFAFCDSAEVVEDEEAIMGVDEEVNLLVLDLVEVVVEEEEAGHEEDG